MRGEQSKHLLALDGLRGLAAVIVMAEHTHWITSIKAAPGAYIVVDFFFCLSGFVLALASSRWKVAQKTFGNIGVKRLVRLYPMVFVAMVIAAAPVILSAVWHRTTSAGTLVKLALGFVGVPVFTHTDASIYPFDGPVWSLACELVANALFYWALLTRRTAVLAPICAASGVCLVALAFHHGNLDGGSTAGSFTLGICRATYSFLVGTYLHKLWKARGAKRDGPGWLLALLTVIFGAICLTTGSWVRDLATVYVLVPVLVYLGACVTLPSWLSRAAKASGHASYPLYVLHIPCLVLLVQAWGVLSHHRSPLPVELLIAFCGVLCAIAVVLDAHVQPRIVLMFSRLSKRRGDGAVKKLERA